GAIGDFELDLQGFPVRPRLERHHAVPRPHPPPPEPRQCVPPSQYQTVNDDQRSQIPGKPQGVRYCNCTSEGVAEMVDLVVPEREADIFDIVYQAAESVAVGGSVLRIAATSLVEQTE